MNKNEEFIKKIEDYLKKDIDSFLKAIKAEFEGNSFIIYGLNISVYLQKSEKGQNGKEVYEVYSLDCSQDITYYNSIWNKYLEIYAGRYSHFEYDAHLDRGWYEKDVKVEKNKTSTVDRYPEYLCSKIEKEEKINTEECFIQVDCGWEKFINNLKSYDISCAFNLSWVSAYIHIPNAKYIDYPKWYVSCYLLIDIADKISDKKFYKKALRPAISKLLFNTSISFHELLIENKQKDLEEQATRAAISQVMARNMSHNIGSHVMNKLVNKLQDINLKREVSNYESTINPDLIKDGFDVNDIFEQLALFNNYIRCRMDYLGDIALGTPLMQFSKGAREIMEDFDKVRLLLENISGLSDFNYNIKLKPEPLYDFNIAMPNELLGCQAFYNIIENVIRNTAKHGKPQGDNNNKNKKKPVQFTVEFIDDSESYYKDELYRVRVYDDIEYTDDDINTLKDSQNEKINQSIVGIDYHLRSYSLGMAEMKASASYLRKIDLSLIDSHDLQPTLLEAFKYDMENGKYSLGYEFYLLKPKEVLYVKTELKNSDKLSDELIRAGFDLLSKSEFEKKLNEGVVFNHQFIVYDDPCIKRIIDKIDYTTLLPLRCFEQEINVKNLNSKDANKEDIQIEIWSVWNKIIFANISFNEIEIIAGIPKSINQIAIADHLYKDNIEDKSNDVVIWVNDDNKCKTDLFLEALSSLAQSHLPYFSVLNQSYYTPEYKHFAPNTPIKLYVDNFNKSFDENKSCDVIMKYRALASCQLLESSKTKVLVLDERIQEARENIFCGVKYAKLYNLTKVIIPDEKQDINLSAKEIDSAWFGDDIKNSSKNINTILCDFTSYDFLVIHYGILERITGNDKIKIDSYLLKWAEICTVVVTSGRGVPSDLPDYVRFVSLSNIESAFVQIRNKYYITSVLHSARKSGRVK